MAGDWIKFELTTPDKPEVVMMAARLKIDQDAVVGKLLRIWAWADANTVAGDAMPITEAFIDRLTNHRKFAAAMREAGWLMGDDMALSFSNFDRHNGMTAKTRAETNRRVAKHRFLKKNGNDPGSESDTEEPLHIPLQKPLPEKRREEKIVKDSTPKPPADPETETEAKPLCSLEQALAYARLGQVRISPPAVEAWWHQRNAAGWRRGGAGNPTIISWQSDMASSVSWAEEAAIKAKRNGATTNGKNHL